MIRNWNAEWRAIGALPVFFVGGLPRSGTTWVQQLLNAHPRVMCMGESHFMNDMVPTLVSAAAGYRKRRAEGRDTWAPTVRGPQGRQLGPMVQMAFAALVHENLDGRSATDLAAVGEKTPDNIMHMKEIWAIFPAARFINVIRDGRDGALSAFIRFRSKLPSDMSRVDYMRAYAEGWTNRIRAAKAAGKGRAYHEVRYEAMHADPEIEAARLFEFVGADSAPETVRAALDSASFESLSGGRQRGQVDAASHYRRGEVGGWADTLSEAEVEAFEAVAGPLMDELGYARATTHAGAA
jgi:hypothetical protein